MVAIKVFEFELEESLKDKPRTGNNLKKILSDDIDTTFQKIFRIIFYSQSQNIEFNRFIISAIVQKLFKMRTKFTDGVELNTRNLENFKLKREL